MTSRAIVSASSKTEWIMFRSPDSTTPRSSAMSTSSRSSTSEEDGPSPKPRPGVSLFPIRISSGATRPSHPPRRGPRADQPPQPARAPGGGQRHAVGVLPPEGPGADADEDVAHHGHHARG